MADGGAGDLIADVEGQTSAGQEVDTAGLRCDSTITPIYPVRYAYANFFDSLTPPANPPSLQTLLGASSLQATNGYVVRLLRPGWVYIREEDGTNQLHIFRYTRSLSTSGSASERFEKMMFANGRNAHGGLVRDESSGRSSYPFAFVAKGTTEISIAYSEHEWHPDVIHEMHGNAGKRGEAMQRVNIVADSTRHSVVASPENMSSLIEDYRRRQDRILALQGGDTNGLTLDILTTQGSYDLRPEGIAAQIQERLCYGETAKVIALHDPLGRQQEIAQAHAKLAVWEQDYASQTMYPYMIGQLCQSFLDSSVEDVKEAAEENLNVAEHTQYWGEMQQQYDTFVARRREFARLYTAFMFPGEAGLVDQEGSLDRYFRNFFAPDSGDESELAKIAETSATIFEGLMASQEGRVALEDVIEHSHTAEGNTSWDAAKNVWTVVWKMIEKIYTTPTTTSFVTATIQAVDKLLAGIGVALGKIQADARFAAQVARREGARISPRTMRAVADEVVPMLLRIMGVEATGTRARLSADEIGRILARALEVEIAGRGRARINALIRSATARLEVGARMLDWAATTRANANARLFEIDEVRLVPGAPHSYNFGINETTQARVGFLFESSFAGLSAMLNVSTITSIVNASEFDSANPLSRGTRTYDAIKLTSAIAALTVDMLSVAHAGVRGAGQTVRVLPTRLATKMIPALTTHASSLGRLLAGRLASGVIAVANLAGAVVSSWDAVNAYRQGNHGAAAGHAMLALAAGVLFFSASATLFGAAGASGATGIGLPVSVICVVLGLIVGGVGLLYLFEKNPLEQLMFQCFWGKSSDYAFWADDDSRLDVRRRIALASNLENPEMASYYQIELQEFMNMIAMPQMEFDRFGGSTWRRIVGNSWFEDRSYDITFILPQFQPGTSDVIAGVYANAGFDQLGHIITRPDERLTQMLADAFQAGLNSPRATYQNGVLTLNLRINFGQRADILWIYNPMPQVYTPLRMLNRGGQLLHPDAWAGGMVNGAPR